MRNGSLKCCTSAVLVLGVFLLCTASVHGEIGAETHQELTMEMMFPPPQHVFRHVDDVQIALLLSVETHEVSR